MEIRGGFLCPPGGLVLPAGGAVQFEPVLAFATAVPAVAAAAATVEEAARGGGVRRDLSLLRERILALPRAERRVGRWFGDYELSAAREATFQAVSAGI